VRLENGVGQWRESGAADFQIQKS